MRPANRDVVEGRGGWLFLSAGSNDVLRFYTSPGAFSADRLDPWLRRLDLRNRRARASGIRYGHLLVPDKLTVYYDQFPGPLPFRAASPALALPQAAIRNGMDGVVMDVLPSLMAAKTKGDVFWKTDTHWTFTGCFAAYRSLCDQLHLPFNAGLATRDVVRQRIVLDLGGKLDPPVQEEFWHIDVLRDARRTEANCLVDFKEANDLENEDGLHLGSRVVYRNENCDCACKIVLFGDSYSECRPHLLTGMLAETVSEVHFIWSSDIDWNYVERVAPDIVISEGAERFVGYCPHDNFEVDTYAAERLREWRMRTSPRVGSSKP